MNAFESQTVVGVFFASTPTREELQTPVEALVARRRCFSGTTPRVEHLEGREGRTACMTTSLWPHGFSTSTAPVALGLRVRAPARR